TGRFETQWLAAPENFAALADLSWDDVFKPVVARYQGQVSRIYFRADAAFAMPEVYEFLEAEQIKYAIRLPANQVLHCSRAQSDDLRTMCAGCMPISAVRPEPGPSRGGLSPRSSGIPANSIPASASS